MFLGEYFRKSSYAMNWSAASMNDAWKLPVFWTASLKGYHWSITPGITWISLKRSLQRSVVFKSSGFFKIL